MFMKRYKKIKEHVVPESDYIILVEDKILDLGVGVENGHYEEEYFELVPLNRARIQEQAEREIAMEEANEILELETNERAELSPMANLAIV